MVKDKKGRVEPKPLFSAEFIKKCMRGEIPISMQVRNEGPVADGSEFKVSNAKIIVDGNETILLSTPITLSTGMEAGDSASLSIPQNTPSRGTIIERGYGRVTSTAKSNDFILKLRDGKKTLKAKNASTHFATLKIILQNDENEEHVHIIFNDKQKEKDGYKHAHIRFGPDGSGRYLRCESSDFECDADFLNGAIIPKCIEVTEKVSGVKVRITFVVEMATKEIYVDTFSFVTAGGSQ